MFRDCFGNKRAESASDLAYFAVWFLECFSDIQFFRLTIKRPKYVEEVYNYSERYINWKYLNIPFVENIFVLLRYIWTHADDIWK